MFVSYINFSTNEFDINNFIDQFATDYLPFEEILFDKNLDISNLKNYPTDIFSISVDTY